MCWIKSSTRPKESDYYFIHVHQSAYVSFNGLEKVNYSDDDNAHVDVYGDYVTYAYYEKDYDRWYFGHGDDEDIEVHGVYKTDEIEESLFQLHIIEWQPLPSFTPVQTPFNPLKGEEKVKGAEEPFVENEAFAELIKFRFNANKTLSRCAYKKVGYGNDADRYVNIETEKQFKAMIDYFTEIETDKDTGEITYKKPVITNTNIDSVIGLYKVSFRDKVCEISLMTSVREIFNGLGDE